MNTAKWKIVILDSCGNVYAEIVDQDWLSANCYSLFTGTVGLPGCGYWGTILKLERVLDAEPASP